jgi:hypothetical protein
MLTLLAFSAKKKLRQSISDVYSHRDGWLAGGNRVFAR